MVRDRLAQENINQAGGSLYEKEARYLHLQEMKVTDEPESAKFLRAYVSALFPRYDFWPDHALLDDAILDGAQQ